MERHNLFITHQHGVRKGRSCATQLIEVLDDWTEQLNNRNAIDTIYLDFQKAFLTNISSVTYKVMAYVEIF